MNVPITPNRAGPRAWCWVLLCAGLVAPVRASEQPAVANVQYSFDSLPTSENGVIVPVFDETPAFTADTTGLAPGTHTLYMRVQSPPGGDWGPPMPTTLTVEPSHPGESITAWEVSVDTPAVPGSGTPLPIPEGTGNPAALSATADLGGLQLGTRVLYFRGRDGAGTWGPAFPMAIALEDSHPTEQAATMEYSWDNDPATRQWTSMELRQNGSPVTNHKFSLDLVGMPLGTKTLAMRVIDSSGSPGLPFLMPVAVVPDSLTGNPSPAVKLVTYAESGGVMIPSSYTETGLGENPSMEQLLMLPLTSAPLGAAEVVSYLVTASGESGPQHTKGFTVVVDGTNGYAAWTETPGFFSLEELLDPLVSGKDADPDKDGMSNEIECALRSHPRQSSTGALPRMELDGTNLLFTFRQVENGVGDRASNYTVDGMRYTVEWSYDLAGAWHSAVPGSFQVTGVSSNGDGTDTVEVTASDAVTAGHDKVFLRLRVTMF
jgi:hypothetical protein